MWFRAAVASATVALVVVGGVASTVGTSNPDTISALLERYSTALRDGNQSLASAALSAAASPDARRHFDTTLENLAGDRPDRLVVTTLAYGLVHPDTGEDGPRQGDAGCEQPITRDVIITYRLGEAAAGPPDPPTLARRQMTFVRCSGQWGIVGDHRAPGHYAVPWEIPNARSRTVATSGGSSAVLWYPGADDVAARLASDLPQAVDDVTAFWGRDWRRRVMVLAAADDASFDDLVGDGTSALRRGAVTPRTGDGSVLREQRIVFSADAVHLSTGSLQALLRHELSHVASASFNTDPPTWLNEGVAEYVGRLGTYASVCEVASVRDLRPSRRAVPRLPDANDFGGNDRAVGWSYRMSWSFIVFIDEQYGRDRLYKLIAALGDGTTGRTQAFTDSLGVTDREALAAWSRWVDDLDC